MRLENDGLGSLEVPDDALYGIHTCRALSHFDLAGMRIHTRLIEAYGTVKWACCQTNVAIGSFAQQETKAQAILQAAKEMSIGQLNAHVVVDALQGGAGTSTNMNVNEVIANRALQLLGHPFGTYDVISPLDDVNRHQSTNDTYPTALKLAAILGIRRLEQQVVVLQEAFQKKEKQFADVVKMGRTEFQDAVLTTLGRSMSAYADVLARDRWRIYKCEERLRVVNLGGTAIGTGLGAPRSYIFRVVDLLREITGIGFSRAENLVDGTQNVDVFVEVSGFLKTLACTLIKISSDLRLLSSGPDAGLGEIDLPQKQAGSSIMPGKVNPVIPEAVTQAAMQVLGYDGIIAQAAAAGSLELNPFLPIIAHNLLASIDLLSRACCCLAVHCIEGIEANRDQLNAQIQGATATATALLPAIGYEQLSPIVSLAKQNRRSIKDIAVEQGLITEERYEELLSPEAVCALGFKG